MLEYRAEGLCRNANHLRREELYHCITTGEVLQSTALAFDTERRLRFELGCRSLSLPTRSRGRERWRASSISWCRTPPTSAG